MGFFSQEHLSGLPCPPLGDLPDPGVKPESHVSLIGRQVIYLLVRRRGATWEAHGDDLSFQLNY